MTAGRLFVAVWPPDDVVAQLAGLPREERPGVRWTTPDQWHVTLRFLGTADVDDVTAALGTLEAVAAEAVLGPRPGRLGHGVFMLPVAGLDVVAEHVRRCTAGVGEPPDPRPFHGHLTLARLKGAAACGLTDAVVSARWPVRSVALVRSQLSPAGACYETLCEVALR